MPYRAHAKYLLLCRVAFKPFPPPTQRLRIGPCAQQLSLGTFTFTQGYQTKMLVANRHMISWFHIYQYKQIQSWLTKKNEMVYHFILWTLFAEIIPKNIHFSKLGFFWNRCSLLREWAVMVIYFVAAAYPRSGQTWTNTFLKFNVLRPLNSLAFLLHGVCLCDEWMSNF